jgi:hypothetical protein
LRRGTLPRAIAHIGLLFSDLADAGQLSSFGGSPDSIILDNSCARAQL